MFEAKKKVSRKQRDTFSIMTCLGKTTVWMLH
ncbi:hypothetical protein B23_3709 [Geobacillus thermoleovorans B23]|nr:hypothetical protein B23_3709 [Geobacillus thermoleovorans B23]